MNLKNLGFPFIFILLTWHGWRASIKEALLAVN